MTESNRYTPYSYNPYQQQQQAEHPEAAPQERIDLRPRGLLDKIFGDEIAAKMRSPLFATVSLLAVGVAFAAIVAVSYPGESGDAGNVPVIRADTTAFKETPEEPGGMDVPYRDSTVFNVTQGDNPLEHPLHGRRVVENLLDPAEPAEEPVDKLAAFAEEAEEIMDITEGTDKPEEAQAAPEEPAEVIKKTPQPEKVERIAVKQEKIPPQQIIKKVEPRKAAPEKTAKPDTLHAAGSSPETIAFVRSVLDKKDADEAATTGATSDKVAEAQAASIAAAMNQIEPTAGGDAINAPSRTVSVAPGNYYVQLGSVTSYAGAESEWGRMKKSLPVAGYQHRIQEANLGERGTYYRIQLGPMSKTDADSLCGSIKAQKPGGCLVVR